MKRTISSRSLGRGLIGVEATKPNTFIAFAAKEGSTAADGDGKNSPFSAALLKHLTRPGLDIRKAFGFVRDDVMSATGNQQEPYTTNSLGGNDVALVPAPRRRRWRAGTPTPTFATTMNWPNGLEPRKPGICLWRQTRPASTRIWPRRSATSSPPKRRGSLRPKKPATPRRSRQDWPPRCQGQRAGQGGGATEGRRRGEAGSRKEKQVEDAKLAAAEQAKVAEQERLAAEKANQEARIASAEQAAPKQDKPDVDKPAAPAVAALTPPGTAAPEAPNSDRPAQQDIPGCCSPNCGGSAARPARPAANGTHRPAGRFRHSMTMPGPGSM
mgnify:CR=1 FL=1